MSQLKALVYHAAKRVKEPNEISSNVTGFCKRKEAFILYSLKKIVSFQPTHMVDTTVWKIPANIKLADENFHTPGHVDLLIGAGVFYSTLSIGQISIGKELPILQNTLVGWVVGGEVKSNLDSSSSIHCGVGITDLNASIEWFWRLEEGETTTSDLTAAERRCENHFTRHVQRQTDDRFVVRIPFESDASNLGTSSTIACQRFKAIERKL